MNESSICKSADHLFLPILEVYDSLLRCVHCNVFAYQDTVKQLAKRRPYSLDQKARVPVPATPYLQHQLHRIRLGFVRIWPSVFPGKSDQSSAHAAD